MARAKRLSFVREETLLSAGGNVEAVNCSLIDGHVEMSTLVEHPPQFQVQIVFRSAKLDLSVVEDAKLSGARAIFDFPMRVPRFARQHLQNRFTAHPGDYWTAGSGFGRLDFGLRCRFRLWRDRLRDGRGLRRRHLGSRASRNAMAMRVACAVTEAHRSGNRKSQAEKCSNFHKYQGSWCRHLTIPLRCWQNSFASRFPLFFSRTFGMMREKKSGKRDAN